MNNAISVRIPCYNAADTLRRAVDSVLDGAPAYLQLILVEDGSPDETGALCDTLAAGDARITALHRHNGGASAARNTGLDAADGDWVLFVDADDTLLPGLWQALEESGALHKDAGMILFGMTRQSGPAPCPLAPGLYPTLPALGDALDPLLFESGYLAAPYPKLYRKTGLRFDESLKINEDILFNLHFLQKNPAIFCLSGVYYKQYDGRTGSLSRRLRGDLQAAQQIPRPALAARRPPPAGSPGEGRAANNAAGSRPASAAKGGRGSVLPPISPPAPGRGSRCGAGRTGPARSGTGPGQILPRYARRGWSTGRSAASARRTWPARRWCS